MFDLVLYRFSSVTNRVYAVANLQWHMASSYRDLTCAWVGGVQDMGLASGCYLPAAVKMDNLVHGMCSALRVHVEVLGFKGG